ncbi:MAG: hypothetical protein LC117_04490 [Bacteroidia bacterium]|nr:hypothetical protein [Bacteroidia bacterium]MCZ2277168.1 hypothetical protein [Bacteroidia bacterium]
MVRTVKYYLIVLFILISTAAGWYFYNSYTRTLEGNPLNAMPGSAALYIKTPIDSKNIKSLITQPIWQLMSLLTEDGSEQGLLKIDSFLNGSGLYNSVPAEIYISIHPVAAEQFDYLFLSGSPDLCREEFVLNLLKQWTGSMLTVSKRRYEDKTIFEVFTPDQKGFTFCISDNVLIGSRVPFLVEDAIRQQHVSAGKLYKLSLLTRTFFKSDKSAQTSVHINFESAAALIQSFIGKEFNNTFESLKSFATITELKTESHPQHLLLTGNTLSDDSLQFASFISKLKPIQATALEILPSSAAFFKWLGMIHADNLHKYLQNDSDFRQFDGVFRSKLGFSPADSLFRYFSGEFITSLLRPSSVKYENSLISFIRLANPKATDLLMNKIVRITDNNLNSPTRSETYNNLKIQQIRSEGFQQALLGNMAPYSRNTFFSINGSYLILSSNALALRTFADDYRSGRVLINDKIFKDEMNFIRSHSNFLGYYRFSQSAYYLKALLNHKFSQLIEEKGEELNNWDAVSFQLTGNMVSPETRIAVFYESAGQLPLLSLVASEKTDSTISRNLFSANEQQQTFILVQDENNQLYKISNNGNIVWTNLIPGKIISPLFIADIYRNKQEQYLFNTTGYLIAADAGGDFISGFPLKLPEEASGAMLAVPFESNLQSAILIPAANGRIYAYQPGGKIYTYWDYAGDEPATNLQHGRFKGKDFIALITQTGKFKITNATGNILFTSENHYHLSGSRQIFTDTLTSQFIFCTENGSVVFCNPEGQSETKNPTTSLVTDFQYADFDRDGSNDLIFLTGSQLSVLSRDGKQILNYDFKVRTPATLNVSVIDNKLFLLVCSEKYNQTWLFEYKKGHFKNSPVKGGVPGFVADMNKDGKLILVTASREGMIYLYAVN